MSKSLIGILDFTKLLIEKFHNQDGIAVDMTLGKGNDSILLAHNFKRVYAFDIQEVALKISKERTLEFDNINFIHDSHENIDEYLQEEIDLFIYNLGYLPKYDESISTQEESTINSLKKALSLLKKKGIIIMVIYPGHSSGKKEALGIESFIKTLDEANYLICKYQFTNRKKSPYIINIQKLGGKENGIV